jgi:thiosulfate/3-mercaptopyruvate sulfurtransferase
MIGSISIRTPLLTTRILTTRIMTRSISIKAPLLVSPSDLQEIRSSTTGNADLKILDASWSKPNVPRNPSKEFVEKHIPGASYLDLDEVATPSELGLKHMMPKAEVFSAALGTFSCGANTLSEHDIVLESFGITPTTHVVL